MNGRRLELTVLACRYCGGVPAEMAGVRRSGYPATVKVIDVPCTGVVAPLQLLSALEQGADGVMVVACPTGGCHHLDGEQRADRRVAYARSALAEAGLDPGRLRVVHLGIGNTAAFAQAVRDFGAALAAPATPAAPAGAAPPGAAPAL
jgi:F420-non-reducing hydrogenase iron-sulfur subunit